MDTQVKRFVSGERLSDSISHVKKINKLGIHGLINHLGENIKTKKQCTDHTFSYLEAINQIEKNQVSSSLSIKLSQIGLAVNQLFCAKNLEKILKNAGENNVFVWIDMEEYRYMERILNVFKQLSKKYSGVGIALLANIKGTGEMLEDLIKRNARIRIAKGAYKEKPEFSFQTHFQINLNFIKLMENLFLKSDNFAIATHDLKMIKHADKLQHKLKRNFEFQFLMGVNSQLERDLVRAGYTVSEYVPYGTGWEEYYRRRIEEQNLHIKGI